MAFIIILVLIAIFAIVGHTADANDTVVEQPKRTTSSVGKSQAAQVAEIKKNYPKTRIADEYDFARPFPNEVPEFVLLAGDDGKMWEFLNGKLLRSTHNFEMDAFKSKLMSSSNPARTLRQLVDSGQIKNFKCSGYDLSELWIA